MQSADVEEETESGKGGRAAGSRRAALDGACALVQFPGHHMSIAQYFARWGTIVLTGLGALWVLPTTAAAQDQRTLVESRESLYNNIYVYRQANYLAMTFGYNRAIYTESVYNTLDDRDLPVAYTRFMTETLA